MRREKQEPAEAGSCLFGPSAAIREPLKKSTQFIAGRFWLISSLLRWPQCYSIASILAPRTQPKPTRR